MRFEHYSQEVLTRDKWLRRVAGSVWMALIVAVVALSLGTLGYHMIGQLPWLDAVLEASMILGGMGPIAIMKNDAVKIFASIYALMSGLVIIGMTGIILAPWFHRLMHHFYHDRRRVNRGGERRRSTDRH